MIIQNSALRLLEIIKTLIASPKTREEICFELDKKGEGIYKNTVSKYFRTLRDTGFEIKKENGREIIISQDETPTLGQQPGFFEKYFGIGNRTFEADPQEAPEEHKVVRYDFSAKETPLMMVAEDPAPYGSKKNDDK